MLKKTARAALLTVAVFASVLMLVMLVITTAARNASAGVPAIAQEQESATGYAVRAYNGHIAVFYGDLTDSPAIETTIEIAGLRAVDREKLLEGIAVAKYDDVLKLLEDFGS
jgi:hypothetical protein